MLKSTHTTELNAGGDVQRKEGWKQGAYKLWMHFFTARGVLRVIGSN